MKFTIAAIPFLALILLAGCTTTHHDVASADHASAQAGEMHLPPGWTAQDMEKMTAAGMPGAVHAAMAKNAGTWTGTSTMWMAPDTTPMTSPCKATITSEMGGRYVRNEMTGEMQGMGRFTCLGFYGYDNVSKKYLSTWLNDMSTGMMHGTGTSSDDGRTITWSYTMSCPITDGPTSMREIESHPNDDTMTYEAFTKDPKSGREFLTMKLELKRQPGT